MRRLLRPIYVLLRLLPFLCSFARDFRRYIIFGRPLVRTVEEHRRRANRLTDLIGHLGGTFIKAIQVIATREDIVPALYAQAFRRLQDQVPPFPSDQAEAIISQSLGRPLREVFEDFEPSPIAAASLSQVHRARYRDCPVAVKVRRPGIVDRVETDLAVIETILALFDWLMDSHIIRSLQAAHQEVSRVIHLEMDFRNEARNATIFRKNFAHDPRIVIPGCHEELNSECLAVFDFVEGCRVDDAEGLRRLGTDPMEMVRLLTETYLRMVLVDGFLHADPHPGNLVAMAGGRVAILDYGMTIGIDAKTKEEMLRIVYCVVLEDTAGIVDGFYRLKMVDPEINPAVLQDAAEVLMKIRLHTDASTRQIQEIAQEVLRTFYKFPLRMPPHLVYVFRAAALVEGIGYIYDEKFNAIRFATPIVRRMLRDISFDTEEPLPKRILSKGKELLGLGREAVRLVHRLDREQFRLRLHPSDLNHLEGHVSAGFRRVLIVVAAAALALWGMLLYMQSGRIIWLIATAVPSAIVILLAITVPLRRKRNRNPWL